jgi:hypothetical protein
MAKRRPVRPSPSDVLAHHDDFQQLVDHERRQANVVTHRGYRDPTSRQLRFIAALARRPAARRRRCERTRRSVGDPRAAAASGRPAIPERTPAATRPERSASADRPQRPTC